jgi:hypothetical protein
LIDWNFSAINSSCPGWTVLDNKLQVKDFSTFSNGNCGFSMPAISLKNDPKHKSVTLSMIQRIYLTENDQIGFVLLGADNPNTRLVTEFTGKQVRQQNTITVSAVDLPPAVDSVYQFWFKVGSTGPANSQQNWFIESIAVNLNE